MADDDPLLATGSTALVDTDALQDCVLVPRALLAAASRSEPEALHALGLIAIGPRPPVNVQGLRAMTSDIIQRLRGKPSARQVEANDMLVAAVRDSKSRADAAVQNLLDVTRWSERDPLTNTPNRALMLDRIACAIALARRQKAQVAVLFVDLDGFKKINDSLGHAAGDEALRLAARRFKSAVRDSDSVSRHSGDEFVVLLGAVKKGSDASQVARHLLAALAQPAVAGKHPLHLSASIGIALYPDDGNDAAALISAADAAMFASKRQGPGGFAFHTPQVTEAVAAAADDVQVLEVSEKRGPRPPFGPKLEDLIDVIQELIGAAAMAKRSRTKSEASYLRQIRFLAARRKPSMPQVAPAAPGATQDASGSGGSSARVT